MVSEKAQYDLEGAVFKRNLSYEQRSNNGSTCFLVTVCFLALVVGVGIGSVLFLRELPYWLEESVDSSTTEAAPETTSEAISTATESWTEICRNKYLRNIIVTVDSSTLNLKVVEKDPGSVFDHLEEIRCTIYAIEMLRDNLPFVNEFGRPLIYGHEIQFTGDSWQLVGEGENWSEEKSEDRNQKQQESEILSSEEKPLEKSNQNSDEDTDSNSDEKSSVEYPFGQYESNEDSIDESDKHSEESKQEFIKINPALLPMETLSDSFVIVQLHLGPDGLSMTYGPDEESLKEIKQESTLWTRFILGELMTAASQSLQESGKRIQLPEATENQNEDGSSEEVIWSWGSEDPFNLKFEYKNGAWGFWQETPGESLEQNKSSSLSEVEKEKVEDSEDRNSFSLIL
ncbi:uncharacterized protein LOC129746501 [Uranotaenia lowii]|uniref:uncharacterized protein LOC129746501 n=1 Tax=Uranotaenia lowii TaxID=190385 RepID=UPI00247A0FEC|nr:uncharacterized protein LOC129746501 [Uranotaenia lowii]